MDASHAPVHRRHALRAGAAAAVALTAGCQERAPGTHATAARTV
ncbi:polysaccharide deacetylase family protein, partial [Streptomyces sp. SID9124]|nr:polysaccharide deacetylase family protein [Streptomyces sp. SID9124]